MLDLQYLIKQHQTCNYERRLTGGKGFLESELNSSYPQLNSSLAFAMPGIYLTQAAWTTASCRLIPAIVARTPNMVGKMVSGSGLQTVGIGAKPEMADCLPGISFRSQEMRRGGGSVLTI